MKKKTFIMIVLLLCSVFMCPPRAVAETTTAQPEISVQNETFLSVLLFLNGFLIIIVGLYLVILPFRWGYWSYGDFSDKCTALISAVAGITLLISGIGTIICVI